MNESNVNKFIDETFTKVSSLSCSTFKDKNGWQEQLTALVNAIPVVGGTLAHEIRVIQDYWECEFFRKYTSYVFGIIETSESQRKNFAEEIAKKAEDSAGNVIAGMVDRLDNINKETVLSNLTRARIDDKISIEMFFRLVSVLERIPYIDLAKLTSYQSAYYDEDGDTELLNSTGVLRPVQLSEDGDTYILSPLGINLLKFGLNINVEVRKIKGTSTNISWSEGGNTF